MTYRNMHTINPRPRRHCNLAFNHSVIQASVAVYTKPSVIQHFKHCVIQHFSSVRASLRSICNHDVTRDLDQTVNQPLIAM